MRFAVAVPATVTVVLAITVSQAGAPVSSSAAAPAAPAKPAAVKSKPTSEDILNACGSRLVKVFAQFGTPIDVSPTRNSDDPREDTVIFSYGDWGFAIRNKTVEDCFFWTWNDPVRGIKIGDTSDALVKVLGKPSISNKDGAGGLTGYGWNLKDLDATLYVDFDNNGKVDRIDCELNE
jgi:hypothetical protein